MPWLKVGNSVTYLNVPKSINSVNFATKQPFIGLDTLKERNIEHRAAVLGGMSTSPDRSNRTGVDDATL